MTTPFTEIGNSPYTFPHAVDTEAFVKAWRVNAWCGPEGMILADVPAPAPDDNQVLIRNHAAGLNFLDTLLIQGKYQERPPLPFTPGAEVAGIIEAVGPLVSHLAPGDRVLARTRRGGFAEYSTADETNTFPVPSGMTWQEAAAFPIVYHTAYYGLVHRGLIHANEWLVVHAGASGIGMAAIQVGKAMKARVMATAGSRVNGARKGQRLGG